MYPTKIYLIPTVLAENTQEATILNSVKNIILETKVFLVENIRTTRRFISSLRLGIVIDELVFYEVDKDTTPTQVLAYFKEIGKQTVGIISEAGCPGIADPGSVVVALAHIHNIAVIPLVGPSSILLALIASGFSGQSFVFLGYLPIEKADKIKKIKQIETDIYSKNQTQIFMETPYRNQAMFEDLIANCKTQTKLCIASNITAENEFIKTRTIQEWKLDKPQINKIPTIFLLYK